MTNLIMNTRGDLLKAKILSANLSKGAL